MTNFSDKATATVFRIFMSEITVSSFVIQAVDIKARFLAVRDRSKSTKSNDAIVAFSEIKAVHSGSCSLDVQAR